MIIRFIIKNLFSFKEETEFNMLTGSIRSLPHHKYSISGISILKMASIYGANGAGKSNLVNSFALLKDIIVSENIPQNVTNSKFKLCEGCSSKPSYLGIEFVVDKKIYFYSVTLNNDKIIEEELYRSGLEKNADSLIFHRLSKTKNKIKFSQDYLDSNKENELFVKILEDKLLKPNQSLVYLLNDISNEHKIVKNIFNWFKYSLVIIFPNTYPTGMPYLFENFSNIKDFSNDIVLSLGLGIDKIVPSKTEISKFYGNNKDKTQEIINELNEKKKPFVPKIINGERYVFYTDKHDEKVYALKLLFGHKTDKNNIVTLSLIEESDGTRRLLDYIPLLHDIINYDSVYIVDEIERSIHPLLVKEVVKKFSSDKLTKGQLIFTTHESNLLDLDIIRQDEIWLTEKNKKGSTELYPLSDYKTHHTIDIRKGYLEGRYGAIPFLGNFSDLNWDIYASKK